MLASFAAWWIARISELVPRSWLDAARTPEAIVVETDRTGTITIALRRKGRHEALTLGAAARLAARRPVLLHPPPGSVLEKHHVVPTAPRRELDQLLRYELARITPFNAEDLFWRWDGRPKIGDKGRTDVTLTLVPIAVMVPALDMLAKAGIQPRWIEVGPAERPRLLAIEDTEGGSSGYSRGRALAWTCAALAVIALTLPVLLQERAMYATNSAIADLQPAIKQVEALRRGVSADGAGREVLVREMARTGDILQVLATVTRILPDDTYLTDFSLRDRQMTLGGRSAGAARLITGLSADPAIRDAAFAAPVTRIEGASADVFSIRAGIAP
jgi:general secretion pathway protein L